MEFSAAERERAEEQVHGGGLAVEDRFTHSQITEVAVNLQCELNRAVELLRRTTHSPKPGERMPLWKDIQAFLSNYPEGAKK